MILSKNKIKKSFFVGLLALTCAACGEAEKGAPILPANVDISVVPDATPIPTFENTVSPEQTNKNDIPPLEADDNISVPQFCEDSYANKTIENFNKLNPPQSIAKSDVSSEPTSASYRTTIKLNYCDFIISYSDNDPYLRCASANEPDETNREGFFNEAYYALRATLSMSDSQAKSVIAELSEITEEPISKYTEYGGYIIWFNQPGHDYELEMTWYRKSW